jgi:hypothetical protein
MVSIPFCLLVPTCIRVGILTQTFRICKEFGGVLRHDRISGKNALEYYSCFQLRKSTFSLGCIQDNNDLGRYDTGVAGKLGHAFVASV